MGYGVIGNTADSGSAILGSSPGIPANEPSLRRGFLFSAEIVHCMGACITVGTMSEREQSNAVDRGEQPRPLSVSARLGRLQFHRSGKFRVLQLADVQDGPRISSDTIRLITAAVKTARPDLVIFSGNQIAGYDPAYAETYCKRHWKTPVLTQRRELALSHTRQLVRASIGQCVQPLIDAGVPWAVTYGNHDFQCGLGNAQLDELYREFDGCVNPPAPPADGAVCVADRVAALPRETVFACEPGTFALPVANERGETVLGVVLVDSGDYAPTGGYGAPSPRALRFLRQVPAQLGQGVRSVVFQHTALPQYYRLLKPVASTAAHAVEGYRMFSGQYYVLDERATEPGGYLGEGVSSPDDDSGEFGILTDGGAYCAIATGHDHRNAFVGQSGGLAMVASPTCGFGSYGPIPERRAARLFEFDIRHPYNPRTQLLEFGQLVGKPSSKKAYVYGMTVASKSQSEGVHLLHKPNAFSRFVHAAAKTILGK